MADTKPLTGCLVQQLRLGGVMTPDRQERVRRIEHGCHIAMGLVFAMGHPDLKTFSCQGGQKVFEENQRILVKVLLPHLYMWDAQVTLSMDALWSRPEWLKTKGKGDEMHGETKQVGAAVRSGGGIHRTIRKTVKPVEPA